MRPVDLIARKRAGGRLGADEIAGLVSGFVDGSVPDYQMAAFLMAVCLRGMSPEETASLTAAMVRSGEVLDLGPLAGRAVDKHSSGGVGDKTSLVLVPLVASAGVPVAKLSGRGLGHTGGTLDKLEAIPGFRTAMSAMDLVAQVQRIGCAIAAQSASLVPADAKLYALRDVTATVDSVPLIVSSIMSKKIASGAAAILLDVKCGRGAFIKTASEARALAEAMVRIGRAAGRRTIAVLTAMDHPLGRTVGNALEVREAIETLSGHGPDDLTALCLTLGGWMLVLGGRAGTAEEGAEVLRRCVHTGQGLATLGAMIAAQGGDAAIVRDPDRLPRAPVQAVVPAAMPGTVIGIDGQAVGLAAMNLGAGRVRKGDAVDPAVGIVLDRIVGDQVRAGERLATVHASTRGAADAAAAEVAAAYTVGPENPPAPQVVLQVVQ